MCMCVYLDAYIHTTGVYVHTEPRKASDALEIELMCVVGIEVGPLQDQQVLLSTEPQSLKPHG